MALKLSFSGGLYKQIILDFNPEVGRFLILNTAFFNDVRKWSSHQFWHDNVIVDFLKWNGLVYLIWKVF